MSVEWAGLKAAPQASSSKVSPFTLISTSPEEVSVNTHGIPYQRVFILVQNSLVHRARNHFAGNLQQRRHRQRRHPWEPPRHDPFLDPCQHISQPGNVQNPGSCILVGSAQEYVVGLMTPENVVNKV